MLQAMLVAALLGIAALAAERVAGWLGVPRRAAWAAVMPGSLLLPALSVLAPGILPDLGIFPAAAPSLPASDVGTLPLLADGSTLSSAITTADAAAWWTDPAVLFELGWLAASLAVLGVVAWTYGRLRRACAAGVRVELDGGEVRVVESVGPAVVGLVRPEVVVPRWVLDTPEEERRLILLHEREHVAAGDAWLLFLGTLAVAAMPWSVPLWWQHRRLRAAVETDCDARVLARGASRRAYGRVLIRTAGSTPGLPLLGPAWGDSTSQLERRIVAMTTKRPSHPLLRSLPLLAIAAAVVATACDIAGAGGDGAAPAPTAVSPRAGQAAGPAVDERVTITGTVTDTMAAGEVDRSKLIQPKASIGWHLGPMQDEVVDYRTAEYRPVAKLRVGGGAWRAGLRDGDLVIAVDGHDGRLDGSVFRLYFKETGARYVVRIRRGGVEREIAAELDPLVEGGPLYQ